MKGQNRKKMNNLTENNNLPALSTDDDPALSAWLKKPESCREKAAELLGIVEKARAVKERHAKGKTEALTRYAESQNITLPTLYRHIKKADSAMRQAQAEGKDVITAQTIALTPAFGGARGKHKVCSDKAIAYAKGLYFDQRYLNISDVYRQTRNEASIRGWRIGSYDSIKRILDKETAGLKTLARKGRKLFEAKHQIKILRDYEEIWPNFMLCGDHHILDVFVKAPGGQVLRPWITMWMDMASRSFMGWCISFNPNSRTIALALAHAISKKEDRNFPQHGLPWSVYVDNGKDYRSKYLNGEDVNIGRIGYPEIMEKFVALGIDPYYIDLEYEPDQGVWVKKRDDIDLTIKNIKVGGVYARLNVHQRYATVYHPWAKPVERAFRNVVQEFSRNQPGWCGSGHDQRPEKLTLEIRRGLLLTYEEICERFYQYVVYNYHKSPHTGHGMNGRTPDEVFLSWGAPQAVDPELLAFALLRKDRVKIHSWGFNLVGRKFELDVPVNLSGANVLNRLVNQYVTVYYDPDLKMVRVYLNGEYMCAGVPLRRASFIRPDDQVMKDKLKSQAYQARLTTQSLERIRTEAPARIGHEECALLELTTGKNPHTETHAERHDVQTHGSASLQDADVIPLTEEERYRMILRKEARGAAISDSDIQWRKEYEETSEYNSMRDLYAAQFDYMKYQVEGVRHKGKA